MANNFPPSVNIIAKQVEIGQSLLLKDMVETFDLDGNPITRWRIRDNGTLAYSGYFSINGVKQNSGTWIEFDNSQIDQVRYHGGLIESSESIGVQVYDGNFWSQADFDGVFTIPFNAYKPVVVARAGNILESQIRKISDGNFSSLDGENLFSVTDEDGDAPVRFMFFDYASHSLSGRFTLNGVARPQRTWFTVEASQIGGLRYVGGGFGPQTEKIGVMAFDGKYWSDITQFDMTTTPNRFAPVVNAKPISGKLGSSTEASNLLSPTDADGSSIRTVTFIDTGPAATSGRFTVNGVTQPANTPFTVPYSQIASVRYHFSSLPETEQIRIQVSDGRYVSSFESTVATAVPRPVIDVTSNLVILDTLELVNFSSLISKGDAGPDYLRYEVMDLDGDILSARLVDENGSRLLGNRIYQFDPAQFAQLQIEGALNDTKRGWEEMMVRAWNGEYWSDWNAIDIATEHVGNRSLTSGTRWGTPGSPVTTVTYAFIDGNFDPGSDPCRHPRIPFYYPCDPELAQEHNEGQPLSPSQRAMVREVLDMYETFANIDFVERAYNPTGDGIMTMFGVNNQDGSQGYAYLPAGTGMRSAPGDIWLHGGEEDDPFDGGPTDPLNPDNTNGGFGRFTVIHEVGHSVGFRHPFSNPINLPVSTDKSQFTVMSYSSDNTITSNPATLMLYDIMELQRLYGVNTTYRTGNDHYRFDLTNNFLQSFWDAGGIDTLNYTQSSASVNVNLGQGQYQQIDGLTHLLIPFGVEIENARGGRNNDTLIGNQLRNLMWGNDGNDILEGNGGNDVLYGGRGDDTYIWRPGDGFDLINEEGLAGRDSIEIHDLEGSLDALQDDMVFRRLGNDLRIDLSFNRGPSLGSITIQNQAWGGFRIETLKLFDVSGEQIGLNIDLTSIMAQATATPQRFQVTSFSSVFGQLAQPV